MCERLDFYNKKITEFYPYRSARCMHSMFIELSSSQKKKI